MLYKVHVKVNIFYITLEKEYFDLRIYFSSNCCKYFDNIRFPKKVLNEKAISLLKKNKSPAIMHYRRRRKNDYE